MKNNFKVGLALGSGAARGLAHIGVIEVLKNYGIPIDMVSGSSAGALVGALYCTGCDFKYVKAIARNMPKKSYVDVAVPRLGFIKGDKVCELMQLFTKDCEFKDLKTPLYITATDLTNKKLKIINDGKVYEAVRASISIPGIFVPYVKDGTVLVDGGMLERVPAKVLKDNGADFVIGVDVGFNLTTSNCSNIFNILYETFDLVENELFKMKKQDADILIRVDLNDMDPTRFDLVDICAAKGKMAAEALIDKIINGINDARCSKQLQGEL